MCKNEHKIISTDEEVFSRKRRLAAAVRDFSKSIEKHVSTHMSKHMSTNVSTNTRMCYDTTNICIRSCTTQHIASSTKLNRRPHNARLQKRLQLIRNNISALLQ